MTQEQIQRQIEIIDQGFDEIRKSKEATRLFLINIGIIKKRKAKLRSKKR